jgi:hypothetical protein
MLYLSCAVGINMGCERVGAEVKYRGYDEMR